MASGHGIAVLAVALKALFAVVRCPGE